MKDKGFLPAAAEISGPEPTPGEGRPAGALAYHYETMVFRFDSIEARRAFFDTVFPGNPFISLPVPGVVVTGMSLSDVMTEAEIYEEALEAIAGGDGHYYEIAAQALDKGAEVRDRSCESGNAATFAERTASPSGLDAAGKESTSSIPTSEAGNG